MTTEFSKKYKWLPVGGKNLLREKVGSGLLDKKLFRFIYEI
jgi:hypothetical protein